MSIEDRVRAATRARTDLVREIRPLELPDELPALARRPRAARRWLSWGAPIGAAALVTALALVLVMLRQTEAPQPGPATPAATPPASTPIPRYYAALAYISSNRTRTKVVVGDDRTGRTVAVLTPSGSQSFDGVTAAADDRTFVVTSYSAAQQETTWYLLRLTPGAAHPAQLTRLPIKPLTAQVSGLALSPDGRELAVMWRTDPVTHLAVYSMSSGAVLHTWITKGDNLNAIVGGANGEALSWVDGDQSIDFRWIVTTGGAHPVFTQTVRRLDVTAPGHDLLADSRVAVQLPSTVARTKTTLSVPCATSVTASDGTVVCGTTSASGVSGEEVCSTVPPSFVTYSGTTGKQSKVLYQYHGQCLYAESIPVWTDSTASHVIAFLLLSVKGENVSATNKFGLVTDGHFTSLPKLAIGNSGAADDQGGLAF